MGAGECSGGGHEPERLRLHRVRWREHPWEVRGHPVCRVFQKPASEPTSEAYHPEAYQLHWTNFEKWNRASYRECDGQQCVPATRSDAAKLPARRPETPGSPRPRGRPGPLEPARRKATGDYAPKIRSCHRSVWPGGLISNPNRMITIVAPLPSRTRSGEFSVAPATLIRFPVAASKINMSTSDVG